MLAAQAGPARPRADDQRRPARRPRRRAEGRRASTASRSASTRCAPTASWRSTRFDELDARARRASAAAHARVRRAQDRHRRHPGRQRRRAGGAGRVRQDGRTPRCGSSSTWTSAAPRTGRPTRVVSRAEMLDAAGGALRTGRRRSSRTARRRPIASRCRTARRSASSRRRPSRSAASCDRSRLTADGMWYLCLYAAAGHRPARRRCARGASPDELADAHRAAAGAARSDRGAEDRLAARRPPRVRAGHGAEAGSAPRNAHARGVEIEVRG